MKTPREILFEHHKAVEPKLDAAREVFLKTALAPVQSGGEETSVRGPDWRAILRSLRWHLARLSAGWLLILVLNIDHPTEAARAMAGKKPPSAHEILVALRENRRQLLELIQPGAPQPAVAHPEAPPRRSELQWTNSIA